MQKVFCSIVPQHRHAHAARMIDKIQHKIGMWLIGQLILSSIVFLVSWLGLYLLGVKYAMVLAILAGFCELIPYVGPFIAAIPAVFFAFVQNPPLAIAVAVLYLLIQKTEGYVLVPKIMQKTVGVSPVFILVAILIGLKLAGIYGVFLAVPVVAGITVYLQESHPLVVVAGNDEEPNP
jgi:predicted PurR-regulated permease PerM